VVSLNKENFIIEMWTKIIILCILIVIRTVLSYDYAQEIGLRRFELTGSSLEVKYFPNKNILDQFILFGLENISLLDVDSDKTRVVYGTWSDVTIFVDQEPESFLGLNISKLSFFVQVSEQKSTEDILIETFIFTENGNVNYTYLNQNYTYNITEGDFAFIININDGDFLDEYDYINITFYTQSFMPIKSVGNEYMLTNQTNLSIIPYYTYMTDDNIVKQSLGNLTTVFDDNQEKLSIISRLYNAFRMDVDSLTMGAIVTSQEHVQISCTYASFIYKILLLMIIHQNFLLI